MKIRFARVALAATLLVFGSAAWAGDHVFDSSFDDHAEGPWSDADAARFLTQATFGPTLDEIARLRRMGYNAWLADQAAQPSRTNAPTWKTRRRLVSMSIKTAARKPGGCMPSMAPINCASALPSP
ncbi:MAG: hypothetical protein IPH43_00985 [Xanthomonadales bacterium]|nr:hypothetical protein [Xanthomonadales bacterium]